MNASTCKWCSSAGFVYFFKYKTVNCHLQVPLTQTGLCHGVIVLQVRVLSYLDQYSILRYPQIYSANIYRNAAILPNGPVVGVVSVGGAAGRLRVPVL